MPIVDQRISCVAIEATLKSQSTVAGKLAGTSLIAIRDHGASERTLLVDCLTLWTSNLMLADRDITAATDELLAAISLSSGPIILVSNEVGLGIVPDNALARKFRDEAGIVNQRVAASVDEVQFLVSGLPIAIK